MYLKSSLKEIPIISKNFQKRFIASFSKYILTGVFVAVALFYLNTYKELGEKYYGALLTLNTLSQNLFSGMLLTALTVLVVVCTLVFVLSLVNSNKLAGPVYRLERSFDEIGNGNLTLSTSFRKGDAIHQVDEGLNSASESLHESFCSISCSIKEIREEARRMESEPNRPTDLLREKIKKAKEVVEKFKTN